MLDDERYKSEAHQYFSYLSQGIYIDQFALWANYFPRKQILVLKSEDFFERPADTYLRILRFLGLPLWQPITWEIIRQGEYEQRMNPATRRRLEEFFEPHNQTLYRYLGVGFGW